MSKTDLGSRFRHIIQSPSLWLVLMFTAFNMLVIPVVLNQYYTFNLRNPHDFCFRAQAIYNTFNGMPLQSSVMPWVREIPFNVLGDHFFLFLIFLVPFCAIVKAPESLLALQTLALSAGAFPVYLIAKERLNAKWPSVLMSVCFLLYPLTAKLLFCDFRVENFAVLFLLLAFYYLVKKNTRFFLLFLGLAMSCKENLFAIAVFFGVYIFLFKRGVRNRYITGLLIAAVSVSIFICYVKYIQPRFIDNGYPVISASRYGGIFDVQQLKLIISQITSRKVDYFADMFKVALFVPLLSKEVIFFIPGILQNLMSFTDKFVAWDNDLFVIQHPWHSAVLLPFIIIGEIYGLANMIRLFRMGSKKVLISIFVLLVVIPILFTGLKEFNIAVIKSPFRKDNRFRIEKPGEYRTLERIKDSLPRDAVYLMQTSFMPVFSDFSFTNIGPDIYRYHRYYDDKKREELDYILYSETRTYDSPYMKDNRDSVKTLAEDERFEKLFSEDGYIVVKKKEPPLLISLKEKYVSGSVGIKCNNTKADIDAGGDNFGVKLKFDGGREVDEYMQMTLSNLSIPLEKYSWIGLEYQVQDSRVQTVEVVVGIDTGEDGIADIWIRGRYPYPASLSKGKFTISLMDVLESDYKNKVNYKVVGIELYPHKLWGVDCSGEGKEYSFNLFSLFLY